MPTCLAIFSQPKSEDLSLMPQVEFIMIEVVTAKMLRLTANPGRLSYKVTYEDAEWLWSSTL